MTPLISEAKQMPYPTILKLKFQHTKICNFEENKFLTGYLISNLTLPFDQMNYIVLFTADNCLYYTIHIFLGLVILFWFILISHI